MQKLILENIAEKSINHYMISDLVDEEYNSVKTLSQTSVNGDVILKFITHDEDKQYIYIGITLKMELNQHLHTKNCKADFKRP